MVRWRREEKDARLLLQSSRRELSCEYSAKEEEMAIS